MIYIPPVKSFRPEEFFSPKVIAAQAKIFGPNNDQIWRLMNPRILWTAVELRKLFGTMYINDYLWGGDNQNRAFRDPIELIDVAHFTETGEIRASWSSFTSQHCFGNGLDSSFKNHLAQDVRSYIMANSRKSSFKYITAIEKEVSWLHIDSRNFKNGDDRFYLF